MKFKITKKARLRSSKEDAIEKVMRSTHMKVNDNGFFVGPGYDNAGSWQIFAGYCKEESTKKINKDLILKAIEEWY